MDTSINTQRQATQYNTRHMHNMHKSCHPRAVPHLSIELCANPRQIQCSRSPKLYLLEWSRVVYMMRCLLIRYHLLDLTRPMDQRGLETLNKILHKSGAEMNTARTCRIISCHASIACTLVSPTLSLLLTLSCAACSICSSCSSGRYSTVCPCT